MFLSVEPAKEDNPLFKSKELFHYSSYCIGRLRKTRARLLSILEDNLKAYINGHPQNVVNK